MGDVGEPEGLLVTATGWEEDRRVERRRLRVERTPEEPPSPLVTARSDLREEGREALVCQR